MNKNARNIRYSKSYYATVEMVDGKVAPHNPHDFLTCTSH